MEVSERELEDMCTQLVHADLGGLAFSIFEEWLQTGGVTFHVVPNQE